jgi:hypothetical protein
MIRVLLNCDVTASSFYSLWVHLSTSPQAAPTDDVLLRRTALPQHLDVSKQTKAITNNTRIPQAAIIEGQAKNFSRSLRRLVTK